MRHYEKTGRLISVGASDPTHSWALELLVYRGIADRVFDLISADRHMGPTEMIKICKRYHGTVRRFVDK